MKKFILSTLLFVLVVSIGLVSCKKKPKETPTPSTAAETNYLTIDGTKTKLNFAVVSGNYFVGQATSTTYPSIMIDLGSHALPTSTVTYTCPIQVQPTHMRFYDATIDVKIVVNNGEYSITLPNTTFTPLSTGFSDIICSGNLTVKQ